VASQSRMRANRSIIHDNPMPVPRNNSSLLSANNLISSISTPFFYYPATRAKVPYASIMYVIRETETAGSVSNTLWQSDPVSYAKLTGI